MSTYYIPNETGWSAGGYNHWLRYKVDTTYDAAANKSTCVITPQANCQANPGRYYLLSDSFLIANSETLIAASEGSVHPTSYYFPNNSSGWKNLMLSGADQQYTVVVYHDASGNAVLSLNHQIAAANGDIRHSWAHAHTEADELHWSETVTPKYTLVMNPANGSTITVTRNGGNLANGAELTSGDVLTVRFGVDTGYTLSTHTVNGTSFTSGDTHTVSGNVTVATTTAIDSYTLHISAGTGTSITVQRTGGHTPLGELSDGATIYYNDVIRASVNPQTGYVLTSATLNGGDIPENYTVRGDVTVAATAEESPTPGTTYTLTITTNRGATVTVLRGNTRLSSGATIAAGDVLIVYYGAEEGYTLDTHTVDNVKFPSGGAYTVSGDVTVAATAKENPKIYFGIYDKWHEHPQFYQWETDRILIITGTDRQPILRFANRQLARALVVNAEESGAGFSKTKAGPDDIPVANNAALAFENNETYWTCKVPNFLLQFPGEMFVSVVVQEDEGEVRELGKGVFCVKPRMKPQDYEYEENIGYVNWQQMADEAQEMLDRVGIYLPLLEAINDLLTPENEGKAIGISDSWVTALPDGDEVSY